MDTAERTTAAGATTYDGFISYSHAADDLLAPRLQATMQRFAKPWWKRRSVRVFRDESSLSANPHLWSSITDALDQSAWFVLLLSPDAARSEWVNQEIEYWTEHKDPTRILPVVTDGDFGWADGHVTGTATPPALQGVFTEEPRWVDLRFARDEEQLDLKNSRFSSAVADIASAIRGIPKDELESEEVKQHRRTIRTACGAGVLLVLLGIVAAIAAVLASRNAAEADRQAQVAGAREFAASAIAVLDKYPELATLLALHAIDNSPTGVDQPLEVINALWRAGGANRLIDEWDHEGFWHSDLSPDGTRFAYFDGPQELVILDAATGEPIWSYVEEDTVDFFDFPVIGPDGRVALLIVDSTSFFNPFQSEVTDELPARVIILDGETGEPAHTLPYEQCSTIWHPEWSPGGRFLVVSSGGACDRGEGPGWVDVYETDGWSLVATLDLSETGIALRPRFDELGALHVFSFRGKIHTFDPETFAPRTGTGATGYGDVSPDGDTYLIAHSTTVTGGTGSSVYVVDAETGATRDVLYNDVDPPAMPGGAYISRDGRLGIVGTTGRNTHIYDLETNRLIYTLPTGHLVTASYDPSTRRLYTTAADDPGVKVWDVSDSPVGIDVTDDLGEFTFADNDYRSLNSFTPGPGLVGMVTADSSDLNKMATLFFDRANGALVGDPVRGLAAEHALENGTFVLTDLVSAGTSSSLGRVAVTAVLWDPRRDEGVELFTCEVQDEDDAGNRQCSGRDEPPGYRVLVSPEGDRILAYGFEIVGNQPVYTGHFRAFDAETGGLVTSSEPGGDPGPADPYGVAGHFGGAMVSGEGWVYGGSNDSGVAYDLENGAVLYRLEKIVADIEASPDRRLIASVRNLSSVVVVDTASWEEVAIIAADARVRGMAFNADGSRLAIADLVTLRVVDTATGGVIHQIGLADVADIHWIDDETIVVGTTEGNFGVVSLATDAFLDATRERLRRTFTDQECDTYRVDPCPTLEEMRNG